MGVELRKFKGGGGARGLLGTKVKACFEMFRRLKELRVSLPRAVFNQPINMINVFTKI